MDKQYYKLYYIKERKHWWFKIRAEILMAQVENLKLDKSCEILNIGAATYKTSELLSEFGNVTSLEYDEDCCEFVRTELKKEIIQGDATNLQFKENKYDLVCAFDVIEHIENDKKAINELKRVCKPNGFIFLTVPAYQFLWSNHDVVNHHFRRYTKNNFIDLVKPDLSKLVKSSYFNSLLFIPITLFRLLSKIIKSKNNLKSDLENFNENSAVNKVFEKIFSLEKKIISKLNLPFGVSYLLLFKN